ncbi:phage Gp37/Gp68 family protein [Cellvibrio japonicus]|uniref:Gp68 n=1 Tax=Cellvibrio japonicus (strain Ueda107) TaxID=498211 RepID=B3PFV6_CELJU|nr:phage Gp37/Gp68 family protein [Cellvibrio japonicus]ACE84630.1 gp68 [Cellvibrio japonicus Ueda107]QEI12321.1 phage Gp37/Gp68 family protein [Cellvibrio japonicus]QEI15894.1 phage Gp37/Gp68 family protein [Cellvibrio japonicus]QEI19473.1 phage Gp37/Gp68 family protein [Cellvibrio japonicus]
MATNSKIEWTEQTWNPVTGCTKVSPGCKYCYAEVMAKRLKAMGAPGYENGFNTITLMHERLDQPLHRKKPTIYFVNSMSDLFHEAVPYDFIDRIFDTIRATPQHAYQILTKRAERMNEYFQTRPVPDNAWLGVSVEDKKYGIPRIGYLQAIKAKTRFLSIEPLLEDLGRFSLKGIHWVIVGGESGVKARPMEESWVLKLRDQCQRNEIDFFFKQWGSWGQDGVKRTKGANGRQLQGQTWDMIPAVAI